METTAFIQEATELLLRVPASDHDVCLADLRRYTTAEPDDLEDEEPEAPF
jgi:hypothetical protein